MIRVCIACVCACLIDTMACADEAEIYESFDNIPIGRIFLTPGQRSWLDTRRHMPAEEITMSSAEESTRVAAKPARSAAGFIRRSDGGERRWLNGDFVASTRGSSRSMKFPGDVPVVRHKRNELSSDQSATTPAPTDATPDRSD